MKISLPENHKLCVASLMKRRTDVDARIQSLKKHIAGFQRSGGFGEYDRFAITSECANNVPIHDCLLRDLMPAMLKKYKDELAEIVIKLNAVEDVLKLIDVQKGGEK